MSFTFVIGYLMTGSGIEEHTGCLSGFPRWQVIVRKIWWETPPSTLPDKCSTLHMPHEGCAVKWWAWASAWWNRKDWRMKIRSIVYKHIHIWHSTKITGQTGLHRTSWKDPKSLNSIPRAHPNCAWLYPGWETIWHPATFRLIRQDVACDDGSWPQPIRQSNPLHPTTIHAIWWTDKSFLYR